MRHRRLGLTRLQHSHYIHLTPQYWVNVCLLACLLRRLLSVVFALRAERLLTKYNNRFSSAFFSRSTHLSVICWFGHCRGTRRLSPRMTRAPCQRHRPSLSLVEPFWIGFLCQPRFQHRVDLIGYVLRRIYFWKIDRFYIAMILYNTCNVLFDRQICTFFYRHLAWL